jgi:hypothetical protein
MDRRSSIGFELRMRGLNERFARYGGVALDRQTFGVMFAAAPSPVWSARSWCWDRNFASPTTR